MAGLGLINSVLPKGGTNRIMNSYEKLFESEDTSVIISSKREKFHLGKCGRYGGETTGKPENPIRLMKHTGGR